MRTYHLCVCSFVCDKKTRVDMDTPDLLSLGVWDKKTRVDMEDYGNESGFESVEERLSKSPSKIAYDLESKVGCIYRRAWMPRQSLKY